MKGYSKELTFEQKTVKAFTDPLNEQIKKLTYENEYLKEKLRIANVSQHRELVEGFVDWFNINGKTQAILSERIEEYLKTL